MLDKSSCCGCGLCAELCPRNAISMEYDVDGFKFPTIDNERCINCGICVKKCSFKNKGISHNQSFYIARSKENSTLKSSASGGLFTVISNRFLSNGFVYGAAYDNTFGVSHIEANNSCSRDRMRDSKYVQSCIETIFSLIHARVNQGKTVLFTGTPCQCSAVSKYISEKKIDKSKVLLVDIICHGVGSPKLWAIYLEYIQKKIRLGKIRNIITRNKDFGTGYHMTILGSNGTYSKEGELDPYICLFNKSLIYRNSCYKCPYKSWTREGDITIGDFQKVGQYFPKYADGKGVSVVIANTEKGKKVFDSIKSELDFEIANKESSSQVNLTGELPLDEKRRNKFYSEFQEYEINILLKKFTNEGFVNYSLYSIKNLVKLFIRIFLR